MVKQPGGADRHPSTSPPSRERRWPLRVLVTSVLLFFLSGVAMAFGKSFVLCSPFTGRAIFQNGEPAAGIPISRTWKWGWNDKSGSDRTVTDANGMFSFPKVTGKSLSAAFLPHEPNVVQTIVAETDNGEVKLWSAIKKTYDLNSEMKGRPVRVKCFVDREPSADGLYWGTCVEDDDAPRAGSNGS